MALSSVAHLVERIAEAQGEKLRPRLVAQVVAVRVGAREAPDRFRGRAAQAARGVLQRAHEVLGESALGQASAGCVSNMQRRLSQNKATVEGSEKQIA